MKKVAIDTGPLKSGHAVRGIGVNTSELTRAIKKINDREIEISAVNFGKTDLSKYDLAHYQFFHPYFLTLPVRKKTITLVTIHDLIYLIYPRAYPPGIKGKIKFLLQKYLIKKIDGIVTISETSKKDIVRFLEIPAEKIYVIHLAPKEVFKKLDIRNSKLEIKKRYGLPDRFVLYVGGVNYNKNLLTLASACKKVNIPLVLVGKSTTDDSFDKNHPENKPFAEFLERYGNDPKVQRLGFVPDQELNCLYNLATIYCQPSFYEGFSLGVLEAQAAGCPVIASKIDVHQEIAGDSVLYFDPLNSADLSENIKKLIANPQLRNDLAKKGQANVKKYSWSKTAKNTLAYYKKVLGL